jgi:RpiB/LacA/LacB family sugar-phosphate isomerase
MNRYNLLLPIAGIAKRFMDEGYLLPKPLIKVKKKTIIEWALSSINLTDANIFFILNKQHVFKHNLDKKLKKIFKEYECKFIFSNGLTAGAAETCLLAKKFINNNIPLVIYTPDVYFQEKFNPSFIKKNVDGLLLTFKSNSPAHSYIKTINNKVSKTAEKKVISENAAVGLYYFKKGSDYVSAAENMISKKDKTNNEYYICPVYNYLNLNRKNVKILNVKKMYVLGTPKDLEFFESLNVEDVKFKIGLCADHSGYLLKEKLKKYLKKMKIKFIDYGTHNIKNCDYSEFVQYSVIDFNRKKINLIIGFCRTGQGINIYANKFKNIRAALVFNKYIAKYAIKHNGSNFISIPTKFMNEKKLVQILKMILENSFDGGRHYLRINK